LAARYGGKWVLGFGMLGTASLTLLTPFFAYSLPTLMALRVCEGLSQGVSFPSMHTLLAHWAPPAERSRMVSLVYGGANMGILGTLSLNCQAPLLYFQLLVSSPRMKHWEDGDLSFTSLEEWDFCGL